MKSVISLLVYAIIIFCAAASAASDEPRKIEDPEVYRIYDKVVELLGDYPLRSGEHRETVRVIEITQPYHGCMPKPETADEHSKFDSALQDFNEKNTSKWILEESAFESSRVRLVPRTETEGLHLSAVGFNKDKTVAVVFGIFVCDGLCGHGMAITLEQKEGEWRVVNIGKTGCSVFI